MASNMLSFSVLLFTLILPLCSAQCIFCLPKCKQPPFPGNFCSPSVVLSVKARVISNSTTVCTGVCDGKGIALGNLKTIYKLRVQRIFKGRKLGKLSITAAGINTFATDPLRKGVKMDVGKSYFINLLKPMPPPIDDHFYIDRCDHPTLLRGPFVPLPKCA